MNFRLQYLIFPAVLLALLPLALAAAPAPALKAKTQQKSRVKADYVLQPEDQLRVFVFKQEDINKQGEVTISQEFSITLPLIGVLDLRGMTARQAEEKIRELYDKDYLVNPQVTVTVQKYAERFVTILGSVKKAGKVIFPSEGGMTLAEAIGGAEGHDRLASLKAVKLTRKNAAGDPTMETVDVSAILNGAAEDIPLQHGDQIYIPERML